MIIGVDAAAMRRQVGPVSWCVLEALAARIDTTARAQVSIRSLSGELGVSKNTVHRAIGVLRTAGLVEPIEQRRDDGRYGVGGYRVTVARSVLAPVDAPLAVSNTRSDIEQRRSPRRSRRVVRPVVDQLSLLPEV